MNMNADSYFDESGKEQMIEVTAPSSLPGGYELSVESQGRRFMVRVVSKPSELSNRLPLPMNSAYGG